MLNKDAKNVLASLTAFLFEYEKMEEFLNEIYHCGNAYNVDEKEIVEFFKKTDSKSHKTKWQELREIIRPYFDDSE